MSFFISSIPEAGLMSRPPVSKVTPLPTSVTLGASSRPHEKSTSRGGFGRRAADRVDERQVGADQIVAAHDRDAGVKILGEPDASCSSALGPSTLARRIDEIAPVSDRLRDALNEASRPSGATRRGFGALFGLKRS